MIAKYYETSKTCFKLDEKEIPFKYKGGRTGRYSLPASLNIFNSILEEIFRKINREGMGLERNGR